MNFLSTPNLVLEALVDTAVATRPVDSSTNSSKRVTLYHIFEVLGTNVA